MHEALETLYALLIIAELRRDRAVVMQLKSDINQLESDIIQYTERGQ